MTKAYHLLLFSYNSRSTIDCPCHASRSTGQHLTVHTEDADAIGWPRDAEGLCSVVGGGKKGKNQPGYSRRHIKASPWGPNIRQTAQGSA